jgi:sugar phosphate isomerase/epimerase
MQLGVLISSALAADPQVLREVAAVPFGGVEIGLGTQYEHRGDLLARLKQSQGQAGIPISSVCVGWLLDPRSPLSGALAREELADKALKILVEIANWCGELGGTSVLLPFFGLGDLRDAPARACAVRSLRKLATMLRGDKVRIGVESALRASDMVAFLDEIRDPRIGCYWDAGNTACLGYDPVEEIRALGSSRIVAVHVKEFLPDAAWKPAPAGQAPSRLERVNEFRWLNTVTLGQGSLRLHDVLRTLAEVGYGGWVALEMFPSAFPDPIAAAKAAFPALNAARAA